MPARPPKSFAATARQVYADNHSTSIELIIAFATGAQT